MGTVFKVLAVLMIVGLVTWWAWPNRPSSTPTPIAEPSKSASSPVDVRAPGEPALASGSKRTPSVGEAPEEPASGAAPAPAAAAPAPAAATGIGGRILGRVIRPDGQPAAHRRVRWLRIGDAKDRYTTTDDMGAFDERDLAPGTWTLATWPDEKELALLGKTPEETMRGMAYIAQASVELTRGMEREIVLGKPPEHGVRAHGHVIDGGQAVDAFMQWMPESPEAMDLQKITRAKAEPGYDLVLDGPGRWLIIASHGEARAEFVVDVPATADFEHDVVLPSTAITGRVTFADGAPVHDARVDLVPQGGMLPRNPVADIQYSHRTDADGRFTFSALPHARFVLGVHGGAAGPKDAARAATAAVVRELDLTTADRRDDVLVTVKSGVKVTGTVRSSEGPTQGGQVFVFTADGEPVNPLDAIGTKDGKFETFALEPGAWFAVAAAGLQWSPVVRFDVPAHGDAAEIALSVGPVAKWTIDVGRMEPAWLDVRDANHCCFSSLLDKHVFDRQVSREWSSTAYTYRLPPGNYDVEAIGTHDRRKAHASLVQGQELTTKLGLE